MTNNRIDGNAIIRENQAKHAMTRSGSGTITDSNTGNILASAFSKPTPQHNIPQQPMQPSTQQMQTDAYDDIEREAFYADEASGGQSGIVGTNSYGSPVDANGDTPMEYMSPQELEDTQMEYANSLGRYSNFAQENGIDMNDMFNRFSEDYTNEDIALFKDARKIKNFDDAVKVGMMNDEMADIMNLDTEKYFGENNVMEFCGEECQQKRKNNSQREIMSMDDDDFEKNFQL